ncbi:hypothetical Protein YC6258_00815 [Gynuella sunshinyii YC6258]|uniref:Uncharacterized protein n=1 Tax=Gynuella sunshinyii YC6258 TaxID=1445510 RepID=A0A0C5UZY1_9GAMM|nr:hypothetical Protein YC6258_00815 [Gynuella sunshinyii YC6258]
MYLFLPALEHGISWFFDCFSVLYQDTHLKHFKIKKTKQGNDDSRLPCKKTE